MEIKKLFKGILIMLLIVFTAGCTGGGTKGNADTAVAPATSDSMPVLHPQSLDSNSNIVTPPTNDDNAIMPDSAIKNK